jgi:hypothetical protein
MKFDDLVKSRHTGESRYPVLIGIIFWIPAFAGMTEDLIEGTNRPLACALFLRNVSIKIGRDADFSVITQG